jgi:hypothetical protein
MKYALLCMALLAAGCSDNTTVTQINPWRTRGVSSLELDPYGTTRQPAKEELLKHDYMLPEYGNLHIDELQDEE